MMPTIRIDEEVWKALQSRAVPFEDTPNNVLRRLLGLREPVAHETMPRELRHGKSRTPKNAYRLPILEVLAEMSGRGRVEEVLDRVGQKMKGVLKPVDYEKNRSGAIRYRNTAMWERLAMVEDGLLEADSPRGWWEISEKGRAFLRERGPQGRR